jgi:hypothetical protein
LVLERKREERKKNWKKNKVEIMNKQPILLL